MTARIRRLALVAIPAATCLIGLVPLVGSRSQLPDPLASHWPSSGPADGSMSLAAFTWMVALVTVGMLAAVVAVAVRARLQRSVRAMLSSICVFVSAMFASITVWTVITQRGTTDWHDAPGPSGLALVAIFVLSVTAAALASGVALGLPGEQPAANPPTPSTLGLSGSEQATWTRRLNAPWHLVPAGIGVACVLFGLVTTTWVVLGTGVLMVVIGIAVSSIGVTVDRRGLTVAWGPFGFPRTRVPLSGIERAEAINVNPGEWGGWGYRGSLKVMGRAAVVLRKGPGIRLDLHKGRQFAVTVDDPATAAALLNDLIARGT